MKIRIFQINSKEELVKIWNKDIFQRWYSGKNLKEDVHNKQFDGYTWKVVVSK